MDNLETELLRFKDNIKFESYIIKNSKPKTIRSVTSYYNTDQIQATDLYLINDGTNKLQLVIKNADGRNFLIPQAQIELLKSTIYSLNFDNILKPTFVYDYNLGIFAMVTSNTITILNFEDKLINLTEDQIKLQILSSVIVRLRYYKLNFKLTTILLRTCSILIKNKLLNPNFKINSDSIKSEFIKKKLIIHNMSLSNSNISLFSKIKPKDDMVSSSSLTLVVNKVYGNLRVMIKKNIVFNGFKINDDFPNRRFPEILNKKANDILKLEEDFTNNNNKKLKTLEKFYNLLYLQPTNVSTIHRIVIRSDADMKMASAFINSVDHYNEIEFSTKLLSIASYLELFFKFKMIQSVPYLLNIGSLTLKYIPHDGHYLQSRSKSSNYPNSPETFEIVSNITKLNSINTIVFATISEINFKLIALLLSYIKDSDISIERISEFVNLKQTELLNKL